MLWFAAVAWASWPSLDRPEPVGGGEQDAALIIGVEDYWAVPSIAGARANAQDWAQYLTRGRGAAPSRVRVLLDRDATAESIREHAAALTQELPEGGTLWVVFVGHAAPDPSGDVRLLGADAQPTAASVVGRGVSRSELLDLTAAAADRRVFVLDACFSGQTPSGAPLVPGLMPVVPVYAMPGGQGATWLSAAHADQLAGPLPGAQRPAFSYLVLGALHGWGDANADGVVTASEAVGWADAALQTVLIDRQQRPRLDGDDRALAPSGKRPAPDLDALRSRPRVIEPARPPAPPPRPQPGPDGLSTAERAAIERRYAEAMEATAQTVTPPGVVARRWCSLRDGTPDGHPYHYVASESCEAWLTFSQRFEANWSSYEAEFDGVKQLVSLAHVPAGEKIAALHRLDAFIAMDPSLEPRIERWVRRVELGRRPTLSKVYVPPDWAARVEHKRLRWSNDPALWKSVFQGARAGAGVATDGTPVFDLAPWMFLMIGSVEATLIHLSWRGEDFSFTSQLGWMPFAVRPSRRRPGAAHGSVVNPVVGAAVRIAEGEGVYPELFLANQLYVTGGFGLRLEARHTLLAPNAAPVFVASIFAGGTTP